MIIEEISLINFRNYGRLDLSVGPSVNIVYGNNAQGKTNLIEAISVCSSATSHKTSKDRNLIKLGEEEYVITLKCLDRKDGYETTLTNGFYTEKSQLVSGNSSKRIFKHDGIQIGKLSEYIGVCNTVTFAPEDTNIVKGAPAARRKFLNMMISKISPSYFNLLTKLNKILEQKNTVIKNHKGNTNAINNMELDYWDFSLADLTAEMILIRKKFIELLADSAVLHHSNISNNNEKLSISYVTITGALDFINSNSDLDDKTLLKKLSEFVLNKLRNARINDIEKGISTVGVHRDDIKIELNNLEMRTYSSQGQQKSAALSLKLAELDIIRSITSSTPILLLDEVFSDLDINRRVKLISGMIDAQIFITCTDREYIENELKSIIKNSTDVRYFRVENGQIFAEN